MHLCIKNMYSIPVFEILHRTGLETVAASVRLRIRQDKPRNHESGNNLQAVILTNDLKNIYI